MSRPPRGEAVMTPVSQLLELALQHYRTGELQQAEQLYLRVLAIDSDQAEALRIIALVACRTGRSDRAVQYLRRVLRLRPTWADAHNDLGMVFISQKRLAEASASFREAVRLQPGLAAAHNNLGSVLRELGRPAEAAGCLQEAVRLVPGYAEGHYNLGLALADQQKLIDALASYEEAVRVKADYAEARLQIGIVLGRLGRNTEAAATLQEVLRLQPDNALARAQLERVNAAESLLPASAISDRESPHVDADQSNGRAGPEPITKPSEPLDVDCKHQHATNGSAGLAHVPDKATSGPASPGPLDHTQASLRDALHLVSDHARLHFYLASLLHRQGRAESALAHYEQVTRLEPDHGEAHRRLAKIRGAQGRPDDASQVSSAAPVLKPQDEFSAVNSNGHPSDGRMIEEQYVRWELGYDHGEGRVGGAMPVVDDGCNERQSQGDVRDSAALDVFFGLGAIPGDD
jgi:protein O-GlcNAc transferase